MYSAVWQRGRKVRALAVNEHELDAGWCKLAGDLAGLSRRWNDDDTGFHGRSSHPVLKLAVTCRLLNVRLTIICSRGFVR